MSGVTAVAGNSQLSLTWTPLTAGDRLSGYGYKVQWKSATQDYDTSARQTTLTGINTTTTITGLTNATTYTVRVIGYHTVDGDGPASSEVTATPVASPVTTLTASAVEDGTATLSIANRTTAWYYKYTVPTGGACSAAIAAGTTTANLTSLASAVSYTFKAYSDNSCTTERPLRAIPS